MKQLLVKVFLRVLLIVIPLGLLTYIKYTFPGEPDGTAPYIIVGAAIMLGILGLIYWARKQKISDITRPPTKRETDKARKLR